MIVQCQLYKQYSSVKIAQLGKQCSGPLQRRGFKRGAPESRALLFITLGGKAGITWLEARATATHCTGDQQVGYRRREFVHFA